jgi:hypothetical protein
MIKTFSKISHICMLIVIVSSSSIAEASEANDPNKNKSEMVSPLPQGDQGLAAQYPGDQGLMSNKHVIFASGFESGFDGWKHNNKVSEIITEKSAVHSGLACAQTTATRGKNTGGDIVCSIPRSVDQVYLRFYCKFHKDTILPGHFVKIRAYPEGFWPNAGTHPPGDKAFWVGIEPTKQKKWIFYSYWYKMKSWNNPDGSANNPPDGDGKSFYGNTHYADNQVPLVVGKWICVEVMVKANTPGKSNGELAFWIDGKLVGHWRPGAPSGSFIRDKFVTSGFFNKNPAPFTGFEFRKNDKVKINSINLQWWIPKNLAASSKTDFNRVYFDDIVVAEKYIGPLFNKK